MTALLLANHRDVLQLKRVSYNKERQGTKRGEVAVALSEGVVSASSPLASDSTQGGHFGQPLANCVLTNKRASR